MRSKLTCREFVEFLDEYLSGHLPEDERARFDAHLARCPACVAYTQTYREAVRLGRTALLCPDAAVPDDAPEDLVRVILQARAENV